MENLAANRALAARYARALFDVAVAEGDPRAVEQELESFTALFGQVPALRKLLWSRHVPVPRKLAIVGEINDRGRYSAPLGKLLKLITERDHIALMPLLLDAYRRRVMEHLGIVHAQVTSAAPLPSDRLAALQGALTRATGKQVTMTAAVDPGIIGGVVARVDSTVYDGSVATQLERIKTKMTEGE